MMRSCCGSSKNNIFDSRDLASSSKKSRKGTRKPVEKMHLHKDDNESESQLDCLHSVHGGSVMSKNTQNTHNTFKFS